MTKKGFSTLVAILFLVALMTVSMYVIIRRNKVHPGTVVIINGSSSSGKSSLINEFKKIQQAYEVVAIDDFGPSYEASHPTLEEPVDEAIKKEMREQRARGFIESWYGLIRDKALSGRNVLVDTVDSDIDYEQKSEIFKGLTTIKVLLYCPLAVTITRVEQRNLSGVATEGRDKLLPLEHYLELYKPQESESEHVLDTISSKDTKQLVRSAIDAFMTSLSEKVKGKRAEIAKEAEELYTKFVSHFKLDNLEEVAIVSKQPHDLILDCRHTPQELAQEVAKVLKK